MHVVLCVNICIWFKRNFLMWPDNVDSKSQTPSHINPNTNYEKLLFNLLVSAVYETPKIFQNTALGLHSNAKEGKSLLKKISYTAYIAHRVPDLEMTKKPPKG